MRRTVRPAIALALLLGSAWVGACLDDDPLVGPLIIIEPIRAPIVSNPVAAAAATNTAAFFVVGGSSGTDVVYVSLPPGTVPNGGLATIRNTRTGANASAAMAAGGFDPVPIPAAVGDILVLEVQLVGGGSSSLTVAVTAARRPIVVRTDPPPRKRDVPLNAAIVVVFSEPIDPATAGNIRLLNAGAAVSGGVAVTAGGLRAEFTPSGLLAPNTEYVVSVSTGVADLSGDALEAAVADTFFTGTTVVVASVATDQPALLINPNDGNLRTFSFSAILDDEGRFTGSFNAFYPGIGWQASGRVSCFSIVDGNAVWVAGVIEYAGDPALVGEELGWRAVDHGPPAGGVPDDLSLAWIAFGDAGIAGLATPQDFCAVTPTTDHQGNTIGLNRLISGNIVVNPAGPPPPPSLGDMSEIAFAAGPDGGIQVIRADGLGWRALTSSAGDWDPAWSPDGTKLAFERRVVGQPFGDIYVIDADGSGLRQLTSDPSVNNQPTWSPDGNRIAFARNGSIHVMNVDGSGVTPLSSGPGDRHATWSPDGTRIAFGGSPGPIWVINADGSGLVQLTSATSSDFDPAWSPDGTRIAFGRVLGDAPNSGLHVMNADGSGLLQITLGINGAPSWSRDGTRLAYEWFGMNVINADGTGMTRIPGFGFGPVWSPVGTVPPAPMPFRSVEMAGGDAQTGAVGTTLAQPLSVRVVRDDGTPEPGVTIRWNMWGVRPPNWPSLSSDLATTDSSGIASVQLTLGGSLGTVRVGAALTDGTARAGEVVFTATAFVAPHPEAPPAPSGTNAVPLNSRINITWVDNATNETGFRLQRSLDSGAYWATARTIGSPNVTATTDWWPPSEVTVCYRVIAFNAQSDSPPSNVDCTALPADPTDLAGTAMDAQTVALSWSDNSSVEDGYEVLRSADGGSAYAAVATVPPNSTAFQDGGLTGNLTYSYKVRAIKDGGGSYSNVIAVPVDPRTPPTAPVLGQPAGFFLGFSSGFILLEWFDGPNNQEGYKIEMCDGTTCADADFRVLWTAGASDRSYSFSAPGGVVFSFRVRATNRLGDSPPSNVAYGRACVAEDHESAPCFP